MSLQQWIVVFQAAITVLLIGGGIYFRHILKSLFDRQLGAVEAELRSVSAEKDRLEALQAPAITAEHKSMKEFADDMASQKQELQNAMKQIEEELEKAESAGRYAMLLGMAGAFSEAAGVVNQIIRFHRKAGGGLESLMLPNILSDARDTLFAEAKCALEDKKPRLVNLARFTERWK